MSDLVALCYRAYSEGAQQMFSGAQPRWVMDRNWYDRLRAELVSDDQEASRARAHADALIPVHAHHFTCPACPAGPFRDAPELAAHMATMADPAYREPGDGDMLFALPIVVRDGGGEPHLDVEAVAS